MRRIALGLGDSRAQEVERGHSAPITSVDWSVDGRVLATGSYDGTVKLWGDGQAVPIRTLFHNRLVNGVRFSPNGLLLASASADKSCVIWDRDSGAPRAFFTRHSDDVNSMAWSPDSTHIATVSEDATGRLWEIQTNRLLEPLLSHHSHCMSIDWSADGMLATCGEDATVRLWDSEGHRVSELEHPGDLEQCRWSPTGELLATACDDRIARVFDRRGRVVAALGPHGSTVKSVSWSPDGTRLAVGSYDAHLSIWDVKSGRLLGTFCGPRVWPRAVHWSPTGERIAIGTFDTRPAILDVSRLDGSSVEVPAGQPTFGINVLADAGDLGVLLAVDDGTVRLWNPRTRAVSTVSRLAPPQSIVNAVAFHGSTGMLAYGQFTGLVAVCRLDGTDGQGTVQIGAPVNSVAFSPDGATLVVADYDGRITFVAVNGGSAAQVQHVVQAHAGAIKSVVWLDADRVVTGSTDRLVKIIDRAGNEIRSLSGHANLINSVDVTTGVSRPLIASASRDKTVRIWDASTGRCERVLLGHDESVKSVKWRPGSNRQLLSGSYDFDVRLWDLGADRLRTEPSRTLTAHRNGVGALTWWKGQPVSGGWDTAAILWRGDGSGIEATLLLTPDAK